MSLNELAKRINDTSTAHGFWPEDKQDALRALDHFDVRGAVDEGHVAILRAYIEAQEVRNMGEMLMLATSELAEALEEHRDGKPVRYHQIKVDDRREFNPEAGAVLQKIRDNMQARAMSPGSEDIHQITEEDTTVLVDAGIAKPEGVAVELADCIIRCLDTLQSLGVDIDFIIQEKMRYNDARPHKHGKAY